MLVLATVNASFARLITPDILTACLSDRQAGWPVHVNTFFTDVRPELILDFAEAHGIAPSMLETAYRANATISGERNPGLEAALAAVATPS